MQTINLFINSLAAITLILFGETVVGYDVHLPNIFIELLQVFSYIGAIVVSAITIYKFIKGRRKNGNSK